MDGDLENIIIASSFADEDNSMGNKTPTIRNSQTKKQPLQTAKKRNIEEDMEWVPSQQPTGANKKVWSEKDEITLLEVLKKRSDKCNMSILYKAFNTHLDAEFTKSQLSAASPELVNRLIPDHVKRQIGLQIVTPVRT
ncbi:hypothetical protein L2E82_30570 [Cichorium intybus]|uniref:Uncharacterized protein n=1 Tax=Cichorium intybus TaxID=13427 RepID=A0ACB9D0Q6_CICIN|nr:hypothetical protein L2E82_30570 [Cichorium intybus]